MLFLVLVSLTHFGPYVMLNRFSNNNPAPTWDVPTTFHDLHWNTIVHIVEVAKIKNKKQNVKHSDSIQYDGCTKSFWPNISKHITKTVTSLFFT